MTTDKFTPKNDSTYVVSKGDCAWKIAKKILKERGDTVSTDSIQKEMLRLAKINNCDSIDDFNSKFFSKIGLTLNKDSTAEIPASSDVATKPVAIENQSAKKWSSVKQSYEKINNLPDDKSKVLEWHKLNPTTQNFVIVDKKACKAIVYSPDGKELTSFMVGLGRQKGDDYMKPNNERPMTSAGIYTIDAQGSGKDAYARLYNDNIFTLTTDKGATGVALHQIPNGNKARVGVNYDGNLENNRYSNGCVNFEKEDFEKIKQYIGVGAKVYILPEDSNNYLTVKNGQLNLTQAKYTGQVKVTNKSTEAKPIKIVTKNFKGQSKEFAQALVSNKVRLMQDLGIDNDTYNDLTQLSFGIAQQESQFGDSGKYFIKEHCQWAVDVLKSFSGNKSGNSRGLTQMKIKSYTDPKTRELFKKYGITEASLSDPKKSALATMIVLGCMYTNELPAFSTTIQNKGIKKMDALLYVWNGRKYELRNGTATPDKNNYIANVRKFSKDFEIYQA